MTKIIAELCQNHNGDLKILDEMIAAASESGAEFVKIQSMQSKELTHRKIFDEGRTFPNGSILTIKRPYQLELERLSKLDLTDDDHYLFIEMCKKYNVNPMTTIFNRSRLKFLSKLDLKIIKVSSFDCSSHKMIEELSNSKFEEIVVSTGATYDHEIKKTSEILKNNKKNFTLMHCVSIYPTTLGSAHLNRIKFLQNLSDNVGLSEHSNSQDTGLKVSIASLLFKPKYIERHFTILEKSKTKDGPVSLNPNELKELVNFTKKSPSEIKEYIAINIKDLDQIMGSQTRELSKEEVLNRDYYRGRFASLGLNGEYIYNWEDKII